MLELNASICHRASQPNSLPLAGRTHSDGVQRRQLAHPRLESASIRLQTVLIDQSCFGPSLNKVPFGGRHVRIFHTDMWHAAGKHLLQMETFVDSRRAAEAQERKLHRQLLKVILAATRCRSRVKLSPLGGTALPVLRVLRCFWMILDAWEFSTSH